MGISACRHGDLARCWPPIRHDFMLNHYNRLWLAYLLFHNHHCRCFYWCTCTIVISPPTRISSKISCSFRGHWNLVECCSWWNEHRVATLQSSSNSPTTKHSITCKVKQARFRLLYIRAPGLPTMPPVAAPALKIHQVLERSWKYLPGPCRHYEVWKLSLLVHLKTINWQTSPTKSLLVS